MKMRFLCESKKYLCLELDLTIVSYIESDKIAPNNDLSSTDSDSDNRDILRPISASIHELLKSWSSLFFFI